MSDVEQPPHGKQGPDIGGNPKPEGVDRRTFLKYLLAGSAAAAAAAAAKRASRHPVAILMGAGKNFDEIEPVKEQIILNQNSVRVWADNKGIPTRWEDNKGSGQFDRERLLAVNKQVVDDFDYPIAQIVRVQTSLQNSIQKENGNPSSEIIVNLPKDVVSAEELESMDIEVIDSSQVGFHIRRSAFEGGGLLEAYRKDPTRGLKIVIVDTPTIVLESFSDPRYDPIRDAVSEFFKPIAEIRKNVLIQHNSDYREQYERSLQIVPQITDNEFLDWGMVGIAGYAIGKGRMEGAEESDYFFLAIGSDVQRANAQLDYLEVVSSPHENVFEISLRRSHIEELVDLEQTLYLDPSQSYTPPEEYKRLDSHGKGTFTWKFLAGVDPATKDPYFVAMHEVEHLVRMAELDGLEMKPTGTEYLGYFSEQEVDWTTWERIVHAYNHYKERGSGELYPFVLQNKIEGYYVIG